VGLFRNCTNQCYQCITVKHRA